MGLAYSGHPSATADGTDMNGRVIHRPLPPITDRNLLSRQPLRRYWLLKDRNRTHRVGQEAGETARSVGRGFVNLEESVRPREFQYHGGLWRERGQLEIT